MKPFTHIDTHTDGMQHKIYPTAEMLHGLIEKVIDIFFTGDIGRDYGCITFFGQFVYCPHTKGHRSICQNNLCTFSHTSLSSFPGNGDRKSTRLNSSHVRISYAV